ncbi:WD40-repeat-containing domain protein [Mycena capillaripes]|nr:WD40-repeat-containing domain protein [Mycena capillaripes]
MIRGVESLSTTTMSSATPSPTTPSTKPSKSKRLKSLFRGILKPSHKASLTPTTAIDAQGIASGAGRPPQASINDLLHHEQATQGLMLTSSVGAVGSPGLLIQRSVPADVDSSQETRASAWKEIGKGAWHGFKLAAKTVETVVDGTPFKIPIAAVNKVFSIADAIIANQESTAALLLPLGERLNLVSDVLSKKKLPKDIDPTLQRLARIIDESAKKLQDMHDMGLFGRILESEEHPKELADLFRRVDEATKNFELEINLANFRQINAVKNDLEISRLRGLRPLLEARRGGLQRETCVRGTREEIIQGIISWCKDTSTKIPDIYWLSGMAGTGKSTIASTICEQLANDGDASRLAASFFCSRQTEAGRKRSSIIPTIAHELALKLPQFRRGLLDALVDANPPPPADHLREFIVKPWDLSIDDREGLPPLVVVVDALDELEKSDGAEFLEDLIEEISRHPEHLRGLKFFITSRRDPLIVDIAEALSPDTVYRLEEVSTTTINQDINTYLSTMLPGLPHDSLCRLADQASGLFIYAATAVRFIKPPSPHPPFSMQKDRLETIVKAWPDKSRCSADGLLVDRLYESVLAKYVSSMAEFDQPVLAVLHTVLCAEEPILVSDIPHLWNKFDMEEDVIMDVLKHLHSVLYMSDSGRVYSYHKSFTDFMFNPNRFVDPNLAAICCPSPDIQRRLAASCFHLMDSLKFNLCDLPSSFLDDFEIQDFSVRVKNGISSSLRYACHHWATHLSKIASRDQEIRKNIIIQMQTWLYRRLLFWIEAMNLLKMIGECYKALVEVRRWLGTEEMEIQKDLTTAVSLVTIFGSNSTKESTPHIYISILAVASRESMLIEKWYNKFPGIPTVVAVLNPGRLLSLLQHDSWVTSASFSLDGSHAISGSGDKSVCIWDVATGRQLCRLDGHMDRVWSVAFSQDRSLAISASSDKTMRIWDISVGKQLHQLKGHGARVRSVTFSQDGLKAISGSDDKTVRIWDVSTGKQLYQLDGHQDWVRSVAFSPDGFFGISGSDDSTIRIWEVSTGKQLAQLLGHEDVVWSVAFSPDGCRAVSGSDDKTVRIWAVSTAEQLLQLKGHKKRVMSVAFSHDGLRAISGSEDRTVRIWDAFTGEQLFQIEGHEDTVTSVDFSQDGLYIISGSSDNTVRIWEAPAGQSLHQSTEDPSLSQDGSRAVSGGKIKGNSKLFPENQLRPLDGHEDTVISVGFSEDGARAISSSDDQTVRIWDVSNGNQLSQLHGHDLRVKFVGFSQDGLCAVTISEDETVRVWDVSTGKQLDLADGHESRITSVAFSQTESCVVCLEISTGKELCHLNERQNRVLSVDVTKDGLRAISGSEDRIVRIWDASTGHQLRELEGHEDWVTSVAFSRDSMLAISGSSDRTVRIWRLSQLDKTIADWHLDSNGWITSSGNSRWMWLPRDMQRVLETPQCLPISSRGSVKVEFTNACLGTRWAQCYDPTSTV